MFRAFNIQQTSIQNDPVNQLNWQDFTDKTKSQTYKPVTANIGNVTSTNGLYTFMGPWLLVTATISGSIALTSTGTSTVSLPSQILIQTGNTTYIQYLPVFNNTPAITVGTLSNSGANGFCTIPAAFFGAAVSITIQGIYLRN